MSLPSNKTVHAGIYVHIPFCVKKCPYCDFYSIAGDHLADPFVEALKKEAEMADASGLHFDTLYFGGGTPSILNVASIGQLAETVVAAFDPDDGGEMTIEVNPGTVDESRLRAYRNFGFDRVNIGIQSFSDDSLAFLGRIHDAEAAVRSIADARRAGYDNIGIDLIYGLPGQAVKTWLADLSAAVEFGPAHISCYMLTYEEGTPMDRQRKAGKFEALAEGQCADLFEATVSFLQAAGYAQYEVSNFARTPAFESRHNWKYWSLVPYVGLGPSAHSFVGSQRYWNVRDVVDYIERVNAGRSPVAEKENLNREQQITEFVYLGLRTCEGIDFAAFHRRFGVDFKTAFGPTLDLLEQEKLADISATRLSLTRKGLLLLDSIVARFDSA